MIDDRPFPPALAELASLEFPYGTEFDIDYEPFSAFETAAETSDWLRSWTGNPDVDGDRFAVFGQDGTGGYAAFWLCRDGVEITEQPVVFLGSEGEIGVVAADLDDLLWLFADGCGPFEAVDTRGWPSHPRADLVALAQRYSTRASRPAADIIAGARERFPGFEDLIAAMCR